MLTWIADDDDDEHDDDDNLGGNGVLVVFNPSILSMLGNAVVDVCVVRSTMTAVCGSDGGELV